MAALAERVRAGGRLVISETFYTEDFIANEPDIPGENDHLALAHRKSLPYAGSVLRDSGFDVLDERVLPGNADAARWLLELRGNIEAHFPEGANPPLEAIRAVAIPLSIALLQDRVSAYSIIAERRDDDVPASPGAVRAG